MLLQVNLELTLPTVDSHHLGEETVQIVSVVFHVVVGLELEILVFQFEASFQQPLHIFHRYVLVHLANQFLEEDPFMLGPLRKLPSRVVMSDSDSVLNFWHFLLTLFHILLHQTQFSYREFGLRFCFSLSQ